MAQGPDQSDFDFGFQPGIDTFAQGGVPTSTAAKDGPLEAQQEAANSAGSGLVFSILIVGIAIAAFALPYFF